MSSWILMSVEAFERLDWYNARSLEPTNAVKNQPDTCEVPEDRTARELWRVRYHLGKAGSEQNPLLKKVHVQWAREHMQEYQRLIENVKI